MERTKKKSKGIFIFLIIFFLITIISGCMADDSSSGKLGLEIDATEEQQVDGFIAEIPGEETLLNEPPEIVEEREKITPVILISTGNMHSIALKQDGTIWAWGSNSNGQLGDGTTTGRSVPTAVLLPEILIEERKTNPVISISAGNDYSMALQQNGSLWAWGTNYFDGTGGIMLTPVKILDNVIYANAGGSAVAVILQDGSLLVSGYLPGSRGDIDCLEFIKVLDDVVAVTGSSHMVAIKSDGSIWAFGNNNWGQLGDGTTDDQGIPVKILDDGTREFQLNHVMVLDCLDNVASIIAGGQHTLAIKKDGTLWSWGGNYDGQLGDGTTETRLSPVKILDDVASISAGAWHTIAIKKDGSLWAWGSNNKGQLGDGTIDNKFNPLKISDDVAYASGGGNHTIAVKKDGSLWAWGLNHVGQLGDGTEIDRLTPVKILDGIMQ